MTCTGLTTQEMLTEQELSFINSIILLIECYYIQATGSPVWAPHLFVKTLFSESISVHDVLLTE